MAVNKAVTQLVCMSGQSLVVKLTTSCFIGRWDSMARSFFFQVYCHKEGQEVSCVTSARGLQSIPVVTVSGSAYLLLTLHFWLCQCAGEK